MPWRKPVKFLLVDDLEENLNALVALLNRDGLELHTAKSGSEALELLLHNEYALALLDVQMPGMSGFELAELMRGTARTRHIPIIFLTAVATDESLRFRGYEAGAVDYLLKPINSQMLRNKTDIFFELSRQKAELAWQRDLLHQSAEDLSKALVRLQAHSDNSPLAIVEFDPKFRLVSWTKGAERMFGWCANETLGKHALEFKWLHEDDHEDLKALANDMLAGNQLRNKFSARVYNKDGSVIECEWYNSALQDQSGRLISINSQVLDVTERKRAEDARQLLVGELNHRVKNTLATVQAIATQTLRRSASPQEFNANFTGRLQSLARAHSLFSSTTWQPVDLDELIRNQLHVGSIDEQRYILRGPGVRLPCQPALHFALILHELGTNARKYGALSTDDGKIELHWTVDNGMLRLSWSETGGPTVKVPSKRGFGSTLIEQIVSGADGEANVSFRAEGVIWTITAKLTDYPDSEETAAHSISTSAAPATIAEVVRASDHRPETLAGKRFLVIEDEPLVALEIEGLIEEFGASVVGQTRTAEQALSTINGETVIDGALLDGNLHGQPVDEIAAALTRRNIPFVFVTGYGRETLPRAFQNAPLLTKPFTEAQLLAAARQLVAQAPEVVTLRKRKG